MLGKNLVETIMGAFVLIVAAIFLVFAYVSSNLRPPGGYTITADFNSIDGLTVGSDVRVGGVKVGIITRETLDPKDYRAVVAMTLNRGLELPVDSKAVVASDGLMGGKYLRLEPGNAKTMVKSGGELTHTEGTVALEELLGKIIFLATDQGEGQGQGPSEVKAPGQGQGQDKGAAPDGQGAAPEGQGAAPPK
ncbi:MAG: outer membrane lipid asymmetry maintenance protein MlaD [Alphaproteobacteria bacterium]